MQGWAGDQNCDVTKKIKLSNNPISFLEKFFIKELFNFENKNFETYIFSDLDIQKEDETTKTIKKNVDFFYNVSDKNNIELANFLRSKNIDILIDINGYLDKNFKKFNKNLFLQSFFSI